MSDIKSDINMSSSNDSTERSDSNAAFEARAQSVLRESAEYLDGRTQSRLTQARYAALQAAKPGSMQLFGWKLFAPITAAAAAAVVAVMLTLNPAQHTSQSNMTADELPDKLEILAADDSLEFYRDVDFYSWLDTELDDATSTTSDGSRGDEA